jgi:tetratricopeptide (TPR) repeat protein
MLAEISPAQRLAAGRLPAPGPQEPGERVLLPWAAAPPSGTPRPGTSQQAADHVEQGVRLAQRNALYLARAEFVAALERIAEASDASQNTRFHGDAVSAGLTALEESRDFLRRRGAGRQPDVARIVNGHKTPILKRAAVDRLSPTVAAERYATYAQEQLAGAAAGHAAASTALFGLGKIAVALASANPAQRAESTLHAAAFYRAALMVDARNFRAANELGVILARQGDWLRARDLLIQSASLWPNPVTHRNLAAIYARLGETQLAAAAEARAAAMGPSGHHVQAAVEWVDPVTFASTAPASDSLLPPAGARPSPVPGETPAAAHEPAESTARRGLSDWLPWSMRR